MYVPSVKAMEAGPSHRLHQARVVLVERAPRFRHVRMLLPGFRNHHQDRFLQRAPGHEQEFQHVVEGARVGAVLLDDGEQLGKIVPEEFRAHDALPRVHPVLVAEQGVDLAVVAHESVRLGPVPGWKRVGRKARMHHGEVRFVVLVLEVGKEREQLVRRQHSLVDDDLRRQAADVEEFPLGEIRVGPQTVRRILADEVQAALQRVALDARRGGDEELLHDRHRRARGIADVSPVRIDRQRSPAQEPLARAGHGLGHDALAMGAFRRVPRQEHVADAVTPRRRQYGVHRSFRHPAQKLVRQARQDARAVAGVLFVSEPPAMDHAAVHVPRVADNLAARAAPDVADEPDAASVLLESGVVQPVGRRMSQSELAVQVSHRRRSGFLWGNWQKWQKSTGVSSREKRYPTGSRTVSH